MNRHAELETLLRYVAVALFALASFMVARPFLVPLMWSGVIVVSTWEPFLRIERASRWPRSLLALLASLILLVIFVVPLVLLGGSLARHVHELAQLATDLVSRLPSRAPSWLDEIPLIGSMLQEQWANATADSASFADAARPWIGHASQWAVAKGAHVFSGIVEILLAIVFTGLIYLHGETVAHWARVTAERIGGEHGRTALDAVVKTIRAVMLGIVGMAVIQASLMALGLYFAGVPGTPLLALISFVLALAQLGTSLVWIPAALWLFFHSHLSLALALVAWGTALNTVDHFVKPAYISKELGLPLVVIFMGVIGGLLTWGLIGAFLGATMLAVSFTLYRNWVEG